MAKVGDAAPFFTAKTTRGDTVTLDDFKGKFLVLYFFPKAFTPGCTAQAKRFRDNYPELRALGAEVLGVSIDDEQTQCNFAEKYEVAFPLVGDDKQTLTRLYDVKRWVLPLAKRVTFVIDPAGKIVARFEHEFQIKRHLDSVLRYIESQRPSMFQKM